MVGSKKYFEQVAETTDDSHVAELVFVLLYVHMNILFLFYFICLKQRISIYVKSVNMIFYY